MPLFGRQGAGFKRVRRDGKEAMVRSRIYWYFRRKLRIAFFAVMVYAALC